MGVWTEPDVANYRQIEDPALSSLYEQAGLAEAGPEERARYLVEEFLNLTMTDDSAIMRMAAVQGLPKAMNALEQLALAAAEENTHRAYE